MKERNGESVLMRGTVVVGEKRSLLAEIACTVL